MSGTGQFGKSYTAKNSGSGAATGKRGSFQAAPTEAERLPERRPHGNFTKRGVPAEKPVKEKTQEDEKAVEEKKEEKLKKESKGPLQVATDKNILKKAEPDMGSGLARKKLLGK